MDAFFASVEQLDNPALKGKAVIVGGKPQSRGVVAACSYEARKFGVRSAMSCAKAARLCPQAIFTRPRMERYSQISGQIMDIFFQYTDHVEQLSVDEAFLDLTQNKLGEQSASLLAEQIRRDILQKTGLTASAGVSCNKFIAKVASDINKPDGITVIPPDQVLEFLAKLPIGKFYGVGSATEKKMERIGVRNGADLRRFTVEELIFHFGKQGTYFFNICRGIDPRPVKSSRERKSIGSETTLAEDILDLEEIRHILQEQACAVIASMQKKNLAAHTLTIKIRYHDFTTITRSTTLRTPLVNNRDLGFYIPKLLANTEAGKKKIRLLGVSVSGLFQLNSNPIQLRLPFPDRNHGQPLP